LATKGDGKGKENQAHRPYFLGLGHVASLGRKGRRQSTPILPVEGAKKSRDIGCTSREKTQREIGRSVSSARKKKRSDSGEPSRKSWEKDVRTIETG